MNSGFDDLPKDEEDFDFNSKKNEDAVNKILDEVMLEKPSTPDQGPWKAEIWKGEKVRVILQSEDFTHDVALIITGDFGPKENCMMYAQALAAWMNHHLKDSEFHCPCKYCNTNPEDEVDF